MNTNNGLILIVDDTEQNLEVLGNILSENGYDLAIATNGIEALENVNLRIPDLILLDIMMPEMDGYETCQRLKQIERTKNIPVIFLTAKIETEDILKGFFIGGIDYITKPFRKEELLARVSTHVKLQKTQKALGESEKKLRNLVQNSEDGIILLNEEGLLIEWNPKMEKLTGLFFDEVNQILFTDIYLKILDLPKEKKIEDKIKNDFKNILKTGDIPHNYKNQEATLLNIDGSRSIIEVSFFSIETDSGYMIGADFRDITVRKRINEEIEKIQKLEAIGTLAAGVAHNFNNLMQGVLGNIQLALFSVNPNEKSYDLLVQAMKNLPRAKDLTNELITFARGNAINEHKIDFSSMLQEIISDFSKETNIKFNLEVAKDLWETHLDEIQIKQALNNIILNAAQSMHKGGTVDIKTVNVTEDELRRIPVIIQKDKYLKISIRDQGIGIPRENYIKIFDPFFTTDMPRKKGLGLSIAYSIIRRHEGYIDFTSEIGSGTTFNVYLPVKSEPEKPEMTD
jgi:two-component system, cell cycle sensor histidine kinase and response regulator CckA